MVGIFVMLVVTIALVAGASASAYFLLNSTQASLMVQQNQIRVQSVSTSIRSAITTFDGRDVVPLRSSDGSTSVFVARVPSIAAFDKTTSGRDIVFCPVVYSDAVNPNATIENALSSGGTESYSVEAATKGGRSYLVAGFPAFSKMSAAPADAARSLNQSGIFGFLLSGDPRRDADLRCASVEMVAAGTFIIDGGTVQPIYGETKDRPASTYVISAGNAAITELDADEKPVGALNDALHLISKYDQANATIYINGDLSISEAEKAQLEDVAFGRSLKLIGQTASTLTFQTTGTGPYALQLKGDVLFNNLTLTSSNGRPVGVDAVPSSRLDIISTDMNFVRASGGTVYLEGQSHIVTASGSAVDASGGSITFAIPGTASSIISSSGSPIFAISGGRILAQTSIYIDASAGETLYVAGTNKSVDKATGSTIFLNGVEPATLVSPYYRPTPVKCANGATSCAIQCSAGTIIAWGECASDNNSALAGFYADTAGQTYTCKWTSDPIPVTNPTAAVVCTNPQH